MSDFMKHIAPKVWPKGNRTAFCYSSRDNSNTCNAKEGNPFGPYWNKFDIDFDRNEFYGPLGYDPNFSEHMNEWQRKYPSSKFSVLAFTGAPGSFPVTEKNVKLQKYVKWSDSINTKADQIINQMKENSDDKFFGLHLRNGIDFVKKNTKI